MFSRYIPAVVPMDPQMLAEDDGARQGAGRGSGKDERPLTKAELEQLEQDILDRKVPRPWRFEPTPYMGMTFYPQERRLDIAIFRALFASSARQAKQFVVHGFVKVNGKKVRIGTKHAACFPSKTAEEFVQFLEICFRRLPQILCSPSQVYSAVFCGCIVLLEDAWDLS